LQRPGRTPRSRGHRPSPRYAVGWLAGLADGRGFGRLRYGGSASIWGFSIYLANRDGYEDNFFPSGSPEDALDCACGLYLNDPTAWIDQTPPK
jgi:hypothetical protein